MPRKIYEFCCPSSTSFTVHNSLDEIATEIFDDESDNADFIISKTRPKDPYYGLDDKNKTTAKNDFFEVFSNLGPNEQFLTNKICLCCRAQSRLLFVVGGIGVGKTSFIKYYVNHVLPTGTHCEDERLWSSCPFVVYFDFLKYDENTFPSGSLEKAKTNFRSELWDAIEGEIDNAGFFSIEQELMEVWGSILVEKDTPDKKNQNPIKNTLRTRLRSEETPELDNPAKLAIRKKIRSELLGSDLKREQYIALLLRYIKQKYFPKHPECCLLIIDNIDRLFPEVQVVVETTLKPFIKLAGIGAIVNVRQTTFYQGNNDNLSQTIDHIEYRGPSPLDIIYARLDNFIQKGPIYNKIDAILDETSLEDFYKGVLRIKTDSLYHERFAKFFLSLCGHSVRKGLVLAQRIINNSVYDTFEVGRGNSRELRIGEIIRAIMIGTNERFEYTDKRFIENVFQTNGYRTTSYFVKLRILKALLNKKTEGVKIGDLVPPLVNFGYKYELIRESVNQLLNKSKRLVWISTAPNYIDSVNELLTKRSDAKLYINSIGLGYITYLFKSIEYMQEVMLDTFVDDDESFWGSQWDLKKINHKFRLVEKFCSYLLDKELKEFETYLGFNNASDYEEIFGAPGLISREISENISNDMDSILTYIIEHSRGNFQNTMQDFRKEVTEDFKNLSITAANHELKLFGRK